ncbi:MAG: hypothetical protein ACRBBR_00665 [Cellvibrionaceae bacterium]
MNENEAIDPIVAVSGVGGGQGSIYYPSPVGQQSMVMPILLVIIAVLFVALLLMVIKR